MTELAGILSGIFLFAVGVWWVSSHRRSFDQWLEEERRDHEATH